MGFRPGLIAPYRETRRDACEDDHMSSGYTRDWLPFAAAGIVGLAAPACLFDDSAYDAAGSSGSTSATTSQPTGTGAQGGTSGQGGAGAKGGASGQGGAGAQGGSGGSGTTTGTGGAGGVVSPECKICMARGGQCDVNQTTCSFECNTEGGCGSDVQCIAGLECIVQCTGPDSCETTFNCPQSGCTFHCDGQSSCDGMKCIGGPCTIICTDTDSCSKVDCAGSCACTLSCGPGCQSGHTCPQGCDLPAGCTGAAECNKCP